MLGKYTQGSNRFLKSEDLLSGFAGHAVLIQMVKEETAKRFGQEQTVCTVAFAEYP